MSKVIVIGAGAAGAMAAIFAGRAGKEVRVFEKNEKTGKKIYITGKGRCNITNAADTAELIKNMASNPKFLYSSFSAFTAEDVMRFFEAQGCPVKVERGRRVFPVSDRSSDVIGALNRAMKEAGVQVHYRSEVKELLLDEEKKTCFGVRLSDGSEYRGDAVIIATGGLSYRSTGSTGDGYRFARDMGHTVTETVPSLVGMNVEGNFCKELEGLALKNIKVKVLKGKKIFFEEMGEAVFTGNGISGPLILSASSLAGKILSTEEGRLFIDLKPALSLEELDARLLRDFEGEKAKALKNATDRLLPKSLIPIFLEKTGVPGEKRAGDLTKVERGKIAETMKNFELKITGLRGFEEAVITKGGVSVKEIDPHTMESKKIKGVFFAGELIDIDALTGGYNLQVAWSTGYVAGNSAGKEERHGENQYG